MQSVIQSTEREELYNLRFRAPFATRWTRKILKQRRHPTTEETSYNKRDILGQDKAPANTFTIREILQQRRHPTTEETPYSSSIKYKTRMG